MLELVKFFRILFLSKELSRERLKEFTEDHIQRLTANNPDGIFTSILTTITTAYNNYFGDLANESLNIAVQKGKTTAMNESRTALEKLLSSNEKLVAYTYRNDKPTYEEFYPQGMGEYYQADLATFQTITLRYKNVLATHAADFTPAVVTDYNTAQALFVTNRNAQQGAMGNVAAERSDITTTRTALATQLTTNVLTIALHYVGDESKADVYFNQAILNAAFKESQRRVEDTIDAGATINVFDNVTKPEVELQIKNTGTVPLSIYFMPAENTPAPNSENTIPPGDSRGARASDLGWSSTNRYLNITNYGADTGSFVVEKV